MPSTNLTDFTLQKLGYADKTLTHWDSNLPAFGIRVGKNTKTFVVSKGKERKVITLGRYPDMSLKDARSLARREMTQSTDPRSTTVSDAILLFKEHCKSRLKPATLEQYIFYLHQLPQDKPVREVTFQDVQEAMKRWDGKFHAQNYAWASYRNFLNWCVEHGHIDKSPLFRKLPPNKLRSRDRVLSEEELARVWRCADDGSAYANIIRMLILTGQRRVEVGNLKPEDVKDNTITFHTKGDRINVLPVTPMMEPYLKTLPYNFNNWGDAKANFDTDCGVEFRHHDLRRTLATTMARLGVPFVTIERILGHSLGRIASIYNRYGYLKEMEEALLLYHAHIHKITES